MSKEAVAEKVVETVAESPIAEKIIETGIEPTKIMSKISDPKIVIGTIVVAGGILVGGYFLKKKLAEKIAAKKEDTNVAEEGEE